MSQEKHDLKTRFFADLFDCMVSIDGTGKRRVDGHYADTRLGRPITNYWTNERFRQARVFPLGGAHQ